MKNCDFTVYIENSKPRAVLYNDATDNERKFISVLKKLYSNYFGSFNDQSVNGVVEIHRLAPFYMEIEGIPDIYKNGIIGITEDLVTRFYS